MRSRLIIPINVSKFIQKAIYRNADLIVLDLEDSIPEDEKEYARSLIPEAIEQLSMYITSVYIRVNADNDLLYKDIRQSVSEGVTGIVLPKVESKKMIKNIDDFITELEIERNLKKGAFRLSILIETAKGMQNINEILQSSNRIDTVSIGMEDLATDMGFMINEQTTEALNFFRMQLLIAAKANNVLPMGTAGSISNYTDLESYKKHARKAFELGFVGSSCIHPNQVELLNESFHYSMDEIKEAKEIINIFDDAVRKGRASSSYKGKMIDYPHYEQSKKIIARHNVVTKYEYLKKEERERTLKE